MGRRKHRVWVHFTKTKEGKWKCKHCGEEYAATTNATRLNDHIKKQEGRGIEVCTGFPQSNDNGSHKPNSNNDLQHSLLRSQGQIQTDDAEDQERIHSSVSNWKNEDLEMMKQYVFECLRPEDKVIVISPLSYLTQEEFITLKPETPLDSSVVDIFVEILTNIERKKKTIPSNWYLPTTFSDKALKGRVSRFLNFVHCEKMKEKYMWSDLESCEKIFIPVCVGARPNEHFYLYIIHLKNEEIEILVFLPNTSVAEIGHDETTKKFLHAMEKLVEEAVLFTQFRLKMAEDILQPNGFDSGIFVINYMQQSDNYVKKNPLFQFDSQREREDLALTLLTNDLNQEKQNLYHKARRHYAQVEKQYDNKRLRLDTSKEYLDDVAREPRKSIDVKDNCQNSCGFSLDEAGQIQGDSKYEENNQVVLPLVSNRENENLQVLRQYVFECSSPGGCVFRSERSYLTHEQFITLTKAGDWLDAWVIHAFVDILTESEKKEATPSNCYLPVTFSQAALESDERDFKDFVNRQKIRENYTSQIKSPEKVFVPVHIEQNKKGHFYLYIFHLNKEVIEIWDSLPTFVAETDRDMTTKKLVFAMEILFKEKKVPFSNYQKEMAKDNFPQPNDFDCGVFVINYMLQSDNYVKANPSFQFDSQKERVDLALKLLNNDLNQEKQNLRDKARGHYAQVEKQDGNTKYDDFDKRGNRHDDLETGPPQHAILSSVQINDIKDQPIRSIGWVTWDGLRHPPTSNKAGEIQADAKYEEMIQAKSSSVSIRKNVQVIRYVVECLSSEDIVFEAPPLCLAKKEFTTLIGPETFLDSRVIDMFVEILTDSERKKAMPLNWYLPMTFSDAAIRSDVVHLNFILEEKMRENYMPNDFESCQKIFIPVHIGATTGEHFYLYIIHLKNKEIEIWDSLSNTTVEERNETTTKLLFAMGELFEKEIFKEFHVKMADGILTQDNGYDCGVFVINFMEQSDNYVKRNNEFQFDSYKERTNLALKLLKSGLNRKKEYLYRKARRYRGIKTRERRNQNDNKRFKADTSKEHSEDVGRAQESECAEFDGRVSRHEGSSGSRMFPITDLIGAEFQSYSEQIREWIKDDKVSAIGVWGMGGSGKTALATHVYDKLLEEGGIKVVWVTVSQNSIFHLQKVIARSIELDISDEFEVKIIAKKLFHAFQEMKKCVVILDDVWDNFFLKEVGFPMSDNRIKFILTTRILDVCQGMGCEKSTIKVESLDREDSWALLEKILGFHEELSTEQKKIARNIAYECEGLPLAIVRIATSMKGKTQAREWSHMLKCLQNLDNGQYEIEKWILPIFRSSYDFLNNKLQRFFLYGALCTTGGANNDEGVVYAHDFIRFFHESLSEKKTLGEQYHEGYNMLDRLKNHGMLEPCGKLWWMNKFLRALAFSIAEGTGKIMANAYKDLEELPSDDQWREDLQMVFLTGNEIETISESICLPCSHLSMLLLDGNRYLNYISDDFFNNMPALKILDLSWTRIKRLPESVSNLNRLTTLLLSKCRKLSYIPPLSKLKCLISLDICGTTITEAPMGMESLVKLRCLNLLSKNMLMSASVISKLINLECLQLELKVTDFAPCLQGLYNLKVILAYFRDISVFNTYVSFMYKFLKFRSFHLKLKDANYHFLYDDDDVDDDDDDDGYDVDAFDDMETYRGCSFKRITIGKIDMKNIKAELPIIMEELFIESSRQGTSDRSLCSALSYGNTSEKCKIKLLKTSWCMDVEYLCCLNLSCSFCFSSQFVGRLDLDGMRKFKGIVSPNAPSFLLTQQSSLFSHLSDLSISCCHDMETLMTPMLLVHLPNLRAISVCHCGKMKEIVADDDHEMELTNNEFCQPPITLHKLTSLKLKSLPELNYVYRSIIRCPCLQKFSAEECKTLNLPQIEISNGCQLPMEMTSTGYRWQKYTN